MAVTSVCEMSCFNKCGIPMDFPHVTSGEPLPGNISDNLHNMARCMNGICQLDFLSNTTSELAGMYQRWLNPGNLTIVQENCSDMRKPIRLADEYPARYAVPLIGYISPILVFLTIINNTLVCIVLLKPHMRSPTNAILVAMAISDMLTGLFPTPICMEIFATDRFYEWLPYSWCMLTRLFYVVIPTIFHTASIWLTMTLAIQRYIYVCHSFTARKWCTIRNVIYGTIAIYVLATLVHCTRFFEMYEIFTMIPSKADNASYVTACIREHVRFIRENMNLYYSMYYWTRVVFINLLPCVSLVVMNALLIYAMRVARLRRMQLLRQNKNSESRKLKESNCTTLMLVAVVGLFLLVEFPLALLFIVTILDGSFGILILDQDTQSVMNIFINFFILFSYPLNFFIYCGMSKQFRETFKQLFTGKTPKLEKEYSQYVTLPTENGRSTAVSAMPGDETAL